MKALRMVALLAVGLASFACAQRGASRGGMSGHSAPSFSRPGSSFNGSSFNGASFNGASFNRGFAASAPRGFATAPRYPQSRSFNAAPRFQMRNFQARGPGNSPGLRSYAPAKAYRRPYVPPGRGRRILYGRQRWNAYAGADLLGYPYIGYPYTGDPDTGGYDDAAGQPDSSAGDGQQYDQQYDDVAGANPAGPPASYYPQSADSQSAAPPAPRNEDAVTLVFKDGRPAEQVRNYALTRTTIYVRDQHPHDISLDELDIVATEKANRDAGVDFKLPETSM